MNFQVWQVVRGSLVENSPELSIKFIDAFPKLSEARAFLTSDAFMSTYIRDQGLSIGQFFIVPESQMFVVLPGRVDLTSIGDLDASPREE